MTGYDREIERAYLRALLAAPADAENSGERQPHCYPANDDEPPRHLNNRPLISAK